MTDIENHKKGCEKIKTVWMPEDWVDVTLGEFGITYSGLRSKTKEDFGSGKSYIPYMNIFNNTIIDSNSFDKVIIKDGEGQNSVKYGDIFFTTSSETPEEVGMCSVYLGDDEELYLNSFCFGYRLNQKYKLLPEYLSHFFRSEFGRKLMYKLAQGSTRFNLSKANLLKEKFSIPPFKEQKRIAQFLLQWDEAMETTQNLISQLQLRKKGLMQELLSGKKRLAGFTEEWKEEPLGSFIKYSPRPQDKPKNNYLALGLRSHGKGIFHKENFDPNSIAMDTLYEVRENDLVVNITFAWEHAIAVANYLDEGGLVSHRFPTYTFIKDQSDSIFFRYYVLQKRFKYLLNVISPGGAGRNRVMSKKDFPKLIVKIPSFEEQVAIGKVLSSVDAEIKILTERLEAQRSQKKGLMQQLLTGKKRVKL